MKAIFYISNYFPSKDLFFENIGTGVVLHILAAPNHLYDGVSQSAQQASVSHTHSADTSIFSKFL